MNDEIVKSDGKVKGPSSRRREFRVMRRTYRTPQSRRDEAQRSPPQADYEAIIYPSHKEMI